MQQQQLFVGAPVVVSFNAVYVVPHGWQLTVRLRRDGEQWADAYDARYWALTSPELADTISMEAYTRLLAG